MDKLWVFFNSGQLRQPLLVIVQRLVKSSYLVLITGKTVQILFVAGGKVMNI